MYGGAQKVFGAWGGGWGGGVWGGCNNSSFTNVRKSGGVVERISITRYRIPMGESLKETAVVRWIEERHVDGCRDCGVKKMEEPDELWEFLGGGMHLTTRGARGRQRDVSGLGEVSRREEGRERGRLGSGCFQEGLLRVSWAGLW